MKVDFEGALVTSDEIKGGIPQEIARLGSQLRCGYVFSSDRELPEGQRQPVDWFLSDDGTPAFQSYTADPKAVAGSAAKIRKAYGRPRNVVVIGNGGSISTLNALYNALIEYSKPGAYSSRGSRLYIVDSQEPAPIARILAEAKADDTVVVPISKSGNTQSLDDVLDVFMKRGYDVAAVTTKGQKAGRLYTRATEYLRRRRLDPESLIVEHPPIGGRYSGRTPVATLPLALLGMNVKHLAEIDRGATAMYKRVDKKVPVDDNIALRLAATLYLLDSARGYTEVYAPMYSHCLEGFAHLTTQLLHESSGKLGRGQTILTAVAPECQHHTNQRFFGGRRNMAAVFYTVKKPEPVGLRTISGVPLETALEFEYEGTRGDAQAQGIPNMTVEVDRLVPREVGALMAFLHWSFGVYPALLRDVNPFDQPHVESSKHLSRKMRDEYLSGRR